MNITILSYGTRGDIQPFVALSLGLINVGHSVRLAAPHCFADYITSHNISFIPLPGDPEVISAYAYNISHNAFGAVKSLAKYIYSITAPILRSAYTLCNNTDLLIHSFFFTEIGNSLAHACDIPDVSVQLYPIFAPTRVYPFITLPNIPPGKLSYFSHWLSIHLYRFAVLLCMKQPNRSERELLKKLTWPFDTSYPFPTPLIFAYSPIILPKPHDWTAPHIHVTGYFFTEDANKYKPPKNLLDFLADGDTPVCVSFGSMMNREPGWRDAIVHSALDTVQQRAIIITGGGSEEKYTKRTDDLLYLNSVPHDWLFPYCRSVVHHGGAGTTAACLRAGIPSIIIPHATDQPFWGKRVKEIGVGPAPINLSHLTTDSLSSAIVQANNPSLLARCQEISCLIRAEDGIGKAIRIIERRATSHMVRA